jgi:uncharacterized protein (DUF924 family)
MQQPQHVLDFWFGKPAGAPRKAWFVKDPLFDEAIRARYLQLHNAAALGGLADWSGNERSALALIIVTDQFPRNLFRGSPRAFETDPMALTAAKHVVDQGWDRKMLPIERLFVYLPFEHSESLAEQERSLALYEPLKAFPETADAEDYPKRHWEIIKRFGRFPHRNAALGRESTAEETEFLSQPGSSF